MVEKTIIFILISSVVAIREFGRGISRQVFLKNLNPQDMKAVNATSDCLQAPTIRSVPKSTDYS